MIDKVEKIFDIFEAEKEEVYLVGGFVRDLLTARLSDDLLVKSWNEGRGPIRFCFQEEFFWDQVELGRKDIDFATSAKPEKIIEILDKANIKSVPIGVEFGTVQALLGDVKIEITTFRSEESYAKGSRKPAVVFGKNIEEDLARRDFTVNAMAMSRHGKVIDPFGGFADLVTGVLEAPLEPEASFNDDPLRMVRLCRFSAREDLGPGWLAAKAVEQMKARIHEVSSERIFEEMTKLLLSPHPDKGLDAFSRLGLLKEIFPELEKVRNFKTNGKSKNLWRHTLQVVTQTPPEPALRWAALFHDVGKPETVKEKGGKVSFHNHEFVGSEVWKLAANRLKTSKKFKVRVAKIIAESGNYNDLAGSNVTDKAIRRFVHRIGMESVRDLTQFCMSDITTLNVDKKNRLQKEIFRLKRRIDGLVERDKIDNISLPTGTGNVLIRELGLKGPELGSVMNTLTQKLVDGDISFDSDFVELAKEIVKNKG